MRCQHWETYVDVVRSHNVHTFHVTSPRIGQIPDKLGCEPKLLARQTYRITCVECGAIYGPTWRGSRRQPAWVRRAIAATLGVE